MNIKTIIGKLAGYIDDPLHRNALFLIGSQLTATAFGFFFWTLATRLCPADDIGQATALVSAAYLISSFSGIGLGLGMIRFLHDEKDQAAMLNTVLTVTGIISLLLSAIFWAGISLWSPALGFMQKDPVLSALFFGFIFVISIATAQTSFFIAVRKTQYSFFQGLLSGARIVILPLMIAFGVSGIFSSFVLGYVVAFIGSTVFMFMSCDSYHPAIIIRKTTLKRLISFSFGNFIGDLMKVMPGLILPLLIINTVGAETNAYFYIAWMIASIIFIVPYAVNSSLLAESVNAISHPRPLILKSIKFTFAILVPTIVIIYFIASNILSIFGNDYSIESVNLLRLLVFASIPIAVNEIYISVCRIRKRILPIILLYSFVALFSIICSYFLMHIMGITGTGLAYLASNLLASIFVAVVTFWRKEAKSTKR